MNPTFQLLPEQASTTAERVDHLAIYLTVVALIFSTLILVLILYFAVKYRREKHPIAVPIHGNIPLEIAWSAIPLAISMVIFAWGGWLYFQLSTPPAGSIRCCIPAPAPNQQRRRKRSPRHRPPNEGC